METLFRHIVFVQMRHGILKLVILRCKGIWGPERVHMSIQYTSTLMHLDRGSKYILCEYMDRAYCTVALLAQT